MDAYLIFLALCASGSLISAVFGLGTAMFVIAAGSFVLPVTECIALATILFTSNTLTKTWLFRAHMNWRLVAILSIGSLPFAWAGAEALALVPVIWLKPALGLLILAHLARSYLKPLPIITPTTGHMIAAAGAYGFLSGLLGTGNMVKAVFLERMGFHTQAFVGLMAATSVLANLAKLGAYSRLDFLGTQHLPLAAGLVGISLVSGLTGRAILARIRAETFSAGYRILLAVLAIALIIPDT